MLILYNSLTGNVKRFLNKVGLPHERISNIKSVAEPYIIVTNTIGFGQVPREIEEFINKNQSLLKGVAASGNRNWGSNFAKAADVISEQYNVPIIHKFELGGNKEDIEIFKERLLMIE